MATWWNWQTRDTPGPSGTTQDLAIIQAYTNGRVRKQEKRRGREPRDSVGSIPTSVTERTIPSSNGTTPARHAGNDGSTPSGINVVTSALVRRVVRKDLTIEPKVTIHVV